MKELKLPLPCCFINIGGIANLTLWDNKKLISFDTGPGNVLLDIYMQTIFKKKFDVDGQLSSKGKSNQNIINIFLKNEFFKKPFPKSLDRMEFSEFITKIKTYNLNHVDNLATLTGITIETINKGIKDTNIKPRTIVIMGGGANNKYLMN